MNKSAIFISYRRDDCAGYAGRIEDTLEKTFGKGSAFRDIRDIQAGQSFADVIKESLSSAHAVLVLIGPRWAGVMPDGRNRIDDKSDFVRLEIATALAANCKVIPVLLSGAVLPEREKLPESLRGLLNRQALVLNEDSWDADVARLIRDIGAPTVRRRRLLTAAVLAAVVGVIGVGGYLYKSAAVPSVATDAQTDKLLGKWSGTVRYPWGDSSDEEFVFERFAGRITGTASFLEYPRGIENVSIDGNNLSFETRSVDSMNNEDRETTHHYTAELDGDTLRFRLQTTGGFTSDPPQEFVARRKR
jgi:hypothetical protein